MSGAGASGPEISDTLSYTWNVNSPLCSFSNINALQPNLTCSDNGIFAATLTVSDSINPPVSSVPTQVTVDNVEPTIAISGASNTNEGSPYSLTLGSSHRSGHGHGLGLRRSLGRWR